MEEASLIPTLASYNSIISTLFRASHASPTNRSAAWDLYSHMRLVSHPTPDRVMYNTMIYGCASGSSPSPERAQDLFQELLSLSSTDAEYTPDADTYTALIRSCTRTRRPGESYYTQGLEYLKQMIDEGLTPSRETLHSIMEGSKRIGDLARARWIFLKLEQEVNEYSVSLLWQAYATFKPAKGKKGALKVQEAAQQEQADIVTEVKQTEEEKGELVWPGPMPQTSKEIVQQVKGLMNKLVAHWKGEEDDLFAQVKPSTFLLNSYQIALNFHAPFSDAFNTFNTIFTETGVPKDGHSYKLMLEACEKAAHKSMGLEAAREVFAEWQESTPNQAQAQLIWTSYIRNLARSKLGAEGLESALKFHETYPPSGLVTAAEEQVAQRHKVPKAGIGLSNESYPETSTPYQDAPQLRFEDLASLYKVLKDAEDSQSVSKLTGMLREYDAARKRAEQVIRQGVVQKREKKLVRTEQE